MRLVGGLNNPLEVSIFVSEGPTVSELFSTSQVGNRFVELDPLPEWK